MEVLQKRYKVIQKLRTKIDDSDVDESNVD